MEKLDLLPLLALVEEHWQDFSERYSDEEDAEATFKWLKKELEIYGGSKMI